MAAQRVGLPSFSRVNSDTNGWLVDRRIQFEYATMVRTGKCLTRKNKSGFKNILIREDGA